MRPQVHGLWLADRTVGAPPLMPNDPELDSACLNCIVGGDDERTSWQL